MKTPKLFFVAAAALVGFSSVGVNEAQAHCQIPCGIFDDPARFVSMREHVTTIEKSMKQIVVTAAEDKAGVNQMVRWVNNKETHADELAEIVTYYFMAQRVKAPEDTSDEAAMKKYTGELLLLHKILVHAMKSKQSTDVTITKKLGELITEFEASYIGKKGAKVESKLPYTMRLAKVRA